VCFAVLLVDCGVWPARQVGGESCRAPARTGKPTTDSCAPGTCSGPEESKRLLRPAAPPAQSARPAQQHPWVQQAWQHLQRSSLSASMHRAGAGGRAGGRGPRVGGRRPRRALAHAAGGALPARRCAAPAGPRRGRARARPDQLVRQRAARLGPVHEPGARGTPQTSKGWRSDTVNATGLPWTLHGLL